MLFHPIWHKQRLKAFAMLTTLTTLFSLSVPRGYGQAVYGSIYGTVFDKSGAVVGNATITARDENKNTSVTVTSNDRGAYVVQALIAGVYDITAQAPGFETSDHPHVRVYVDSSAKVDVVLQPGLPASQ